MAKRPLKAPKVPVDIYKNTTEKLQNFDSHPWLMHHEDGNLPYKMCSRCRINLSEFVQKNFISCDDYVVTAVARRLMK